MGIFLGDPKVVTSPTNLTLRRNMKLSGNYDSPQEHSGTAKWNMDNQINATLTNGTGSGNVLWSFIHSFAPKVDGEGGNFNFNDGSLYDVYGKPIESTTLVEIIVINNSVTSGETVTVVIGSNYTFDVGPGFTSGSIVNPCMGMVQSWQDGITVGVGSGEQLFISSDAGRPDVDLQVSGR